MPISSYCGYNQSPSFDTTILALLKEVSPGGHTRWPRLDDHVWPGANAALLAVRDDPSATALLARLQELRDKVGTLTGIWALPPVCETLR